MFKLFSIIKEEIILQVTYFKSPSYFFFSIFMEISISNCTSILLSLPSKDPQENNCIIIIMMISSCFEPKLGDIGGWNSATSCAKKKTKRRQKKRREKVGKRVVCATVVRVYPMIGNSASEKPENLILPFARGTTRDSFPDQRTARLAGRDTTVASKNDSKQYCHGARTRKDFNFWSFRWNERRMRERKWKKKERKEKKNIPARCRSLTLPLFRFSLFFARWFLFFFSLSSLPLQIWCIQRSFSIPEGKVVRLAKEIIIQGVDNENYAGDGWYNRNSFPLCEHRPCLSTKRRLETSPPTNLHFEISLPRTSVRPQESYSVWPRLGLRVELMRGQNDWLTVMEMMKICV